MNKTIYIADDEENIRNLVGSFLKKEGYFVKTFENGELLLSEYKKNPCDLIILDIMMPGLDGFAVCSEIRAYSTVPIIMLSARDTDVDYATGITLGSDDYFTKPFSPMSLVMRVKAIFRRQEYEKQEKNLAKKLTFADMVIDEKSKTVTYSDIPVELTPNEYALLCYLFENKDKAVSRTELLNKIWGFDSEVETRAADDTVKRLRKKISKSRVIIDTVWGFGFRLKDANELKN